jgi:hypothetical protein
MAGNPFGAISSLIAKLAPANRGLSLPLSLGLGGISSLIGGLFGGSQNAANNKAAMERQQQQQQWQEKMGQQRMNLLKPQVPYYQTTAVPYLSNLVQKTILGNLGTNLGGDLLKKYGIDLGDYSNVAGLTGLYSQNPEAKKYYPGYFQSQTGIPNQGLGAGDWREKLMERYGGKREAA